VRMQSGGVHSCVLSLREAFFTFSSPALSPRPHLGHSFLEGARE
jgi:hypothetical protein